MAGIQIFQIAVAVENAKEHRRVAANLGVLAQESIDVLENARGIGADGHARKRALQHGGQQRGAQAFAGNVGDQESGAVFVDRKHVEIVAANLLARLVDAA